MVPYSFHWLPRPRDKEPGAVAGTFRSCVETPRVLSPSSYGSHSGGARPADGTFHPGGDQALVGHAATAESTGRLCLSFLFNSHSDLVRPSSLDINTGPERPTVSLRRAEPHARPCPRSLQPAEGVLAPLVTQGTPRSSALFRLASDMSSFLLFHVRWWQRKALGLRRKQPREAR